jgi:hypothetical protein
VFSNISGASGDEVDLRDAGMRIRGEIIDRAAAESRQGGISAPR